jgi:hypothetical protein
MQDRSCYQHHLRSGFGLLVNYHSSHLSVLIVLLRSFDIGILWSCIGSFGYAFELAHLLGHRWIWADF